MNLLIIPARGGSKRIPKKNIKFFFGQPMIAWSINAALESKCFDRVIVSTDDAEIAKVAQEFGAEAPFIRPAELSDDHTGTSAVVRHAIDALAVQGENYTNVCCLYATAPFITGGTLQQAFNLYTDKKPAYVFSVASFPYPIQRAVRINPEGFIEFRENQYASTRSQDLEAMYHDAGQFYIGSTESWLAKKSVFSAHSLPFILPRYLVQDIDTEEDWLQAELMMQALQQRI